MSTLHRYVGERIASHLGEGAGPHAKKTYGSDQTGSKVYRFNSLGFRGEEFEQLAKRNVFLCGCSYAFGVGLNQEETFANLFKERYASTHGCGLDEVNLLNFSQGGASNDYIARTLLTQAARIRPDLVVGLLTHPNRTEFFLGEPGDRVRVWGIGPWVAHGAVGAREVGGERREELTPEEEAQLYYLYYSDELGFSNALRNLLLLQHYCASRAIPCVLAWLGRSSLDERRFREHPVLGGLIELIDVERLCPSSFADSDVFVDRAADGEHPGPRSNEIYAGRVFATYQAALV